MIRAVFAILAVMSAACTPAGERIGQIGQIEQTLPIFPDYAGVTVPPNIAPVNFAPATEFDRAVATFTGGGKTLSVKARGGQFTISPARWSEMLRLSVGDTIRVGVTIRNRGVWRSHRPFEIYVAPEPIDPYIAYRLIEPGYELWNRMGIYQRNLETFDRSPILENSSTRGSCMNCHSFHMQDPERMLFHLRGQIAATMVTDGDRVEKLDTKTAHTLSALVYPSWHPGGRFVAFSVNDTRQAFHTIDPNRAEVYDNASDVVVYDTHRHRIITTPLLHGTADFESFPSFSPDGGTLYFSSSPFVSNVIASPDSVRYSLCSISFDPDTGSYGHTVDTLYNARTEGRSASFPRVSPDGSRLMYTLADYGGFAIWHKESDLWTIDLATGLHSPLSAANSSAADSYHSWSSNSRWVIFASRRLDGLYSRPFIAYVDRDGVARKAFVVPQKKVGFYHSLMCSYNVPEFIKGRVESRRALSHSAKNAESIKVTVGQ